MVRHSLRTVATERGTRSSRRRSTQTQACLFDTGLRCSSEREGMVRQALLEMADPC